MFQIRRICFSNRLKIHEVIKVRRSFVIKNNNCNICKLVCFAR